MNAKSSDEEEVDIMKYLTILLVRKWWLLGTVLLVLGICQWINTQAPKKYVSYSRLSVKVNPIENVVGNWYVSERDYRTASHYENLKIPDQAFLESVSQRMGEKLPARKIEQYYTVEQARESNLIFLKTSTPDPDLSRQLADQLAKAYEEYDLQFRQRSYLEREEWIQEQIAARESTLNSLEQKFKQFKEEHPTFTGERNVSAVVGLEAELRNIILEQEEEGHRLSLVQAALSNLDSVVVAEVKRDQPLQKELIALELELAKLKVEHGEESRKVKNILQQMDNIKGLLKKGMESDAYTTTLQTNPRFLRLQTEKDEIISNISVLSARKKELEKMIAGAYEKTALEPALQLQYSSMDRDQEASRKIYNMLNEKLEENRLKKSGVSREVYQIGRASAPQEVREGTIGLEMSLLIGLLLGILVSFMIEQLDKTIRFPTQIEKNFGIPLLGIIPELELDSGKLDLNTDSKILEPYRSLRTNLNYSSPISGKSSKTIIITSALQGEGKSTKAVNLAICFALDGKKILLVDSDLRRPSVHRLLNLKHGPGLSEYLTGQADYRDVQVETPYHGLTIVPAGNKMPNPAEILGSPKVKTFLETASSEYDVVFFDSPAIFPVSDALVLAPLMDGALVVFRSNYTPIKAGEEVLRKLTQVGTSILGGVLNDVRSGKGGYYYSYYGYYGYSYYQTYYEEGRPNTRHPWLHAMLKRFRDKWLGIHNILKLNKIYKILKWLLILLTVLTLVSLGFIFYFKSQQAPDYIPLNEWKMEN